jgi:hypothetical protein
VNVEVERVLRRHLHDPGSRQELLCLLGELAAQAPARDAARSRFTDLADALVAREHITYGEACRRLASEQRELYAEVRAAAR